MKPIDVHTHYFPDAIAQQSVDALRKEGAFEPNGNGTLASLREFMEKDGVGLSVNLPVATRKDQVVGINRKMVACNKGHGKDVLCFGAMHPDFRTVGNVREEIQFLAEEGIKGVKLHPEYQKFYPDDPAMQDIYEACRDCGLIITFHAGFDFPYPEHIRALPRRLQAVTKIDGLKLIFAHLGGYRMWDDVLKYLAGTDARLDTAYTQDIDDAVFCQIVKEHGEDKILFGTDFPWSRARDIKAVIDRAVDDPGTREKIYCRNAQKLLSL